MRRMGWQMSTLLMAVCKLYCISTVQGSMTIYNTSFAVLQTYLKMTFMFGLLVIGNVTDNISQPRWVILFMQIVLGIIWILTGILV